MHKKTLITFALILSIALLTACESAPAVTDAPEAVSDLAFTIVDDVLAESLDSRQNGSGAYQHAELEIGRLEEKPLAQDAIDDGVTALWCAGVTYQIAANDGENAGLWRDAELIVLIFEKGPGQMGGGEWYAQNVSALSAGLDEYNDIAYEECLGR